MDIFVIRDILDQICNYLNPNEVFNLHKSFDLLMDIKYVENLMNKNRGISKCYACYLNLKDKMNCPCCKSNYCKSCFEIYKKYCKCYAILCIYCFDRDMCKSCFLNYIRFGK